MKLAQALIQDSKITEFLEIRRIEQIPVQRSKKVKRFVYELVYCSESSRNLGSEVVIQVTGKHPLSGASLVALAHQAIRAGQFNPKNRYAKKVAKPKIELFH